MPAQLEINMYTLLETVNYVIAQVGATAATTLSSPLPDVQDSQLRINEALVSVLKRGWWFNTDFNVVLETDGNDKLPIPADVMKILRCSPYFLIERGGFAYDPYNQTDTFTDIEDVTIDYIRKLSYEDCPGSAQDLIRLVAAREHILIELEDRNKAQLFDEPIQLAWLDVKKDDLQIKQRNAIYAPSFIRTRGGVRPYRFGGRGVNPTYPGG